MRNSHYEYDKFIVTHLVHNSVGADSYSAKPTVLTLQRTSGEWVFAKTIDSMRDAKPISLRSSGEFFRCAALNPNRVAHP